MDNLEMLAHYVRCLSEETTTHTDDIINILSGVCWDEERAGNIKNCIKSGGGE